MPLYHTIPLHVLIPLLLAVYPAFHAVGKRPDDCDVCDGRCPVVAIKTNLLHDAVMTPDLGLELSLSNRVSVGIEGVYAWWSNESKHRCWRIRGGWLDVSCWLGSTSYRQRLTGHHAGIYVSMHDYGLCGKRPGDYASSYGSLPCRRC